MIDYQFLPKDLKQYLEPNYNWKIASGENELTAKNQTNNLRLILNSIVRFNYADFKKFIQIKQDLGEPLLYLNSRILEARQFALFLKQQEFAVDARLLTFPTFKSEFTH
ncbi:MAG: hypothetical protein A3F35_03080 [Candidatus Woykebacteria bacterium RIFCSPHIGHO2_12_FULL_45_10]|uniref:Uncharacterized protein n=1 Tax=Candidatus Woykebacteria bacterium RIFCSPHIGHO2_12_FULL_45_10 TaxID=1802603 RepID=A0A1G1WN82_9BACT|nr:MAG: hypothetical protein A3F35_03080 [Candidatus Woykebacteria bacterium RIFCSPHIGHO2_12_FULL_45_10]